MTDYAKMARECRDELAIVEKYLEGARARHRQTHDPDDARALDTLESIRMELKFKEREFRRRAGMHGMEDEK